MMRQASNSQRKQFSCQHLNTQDVSYWLKLAVGKRLCIRHSAPENCGHLRNAKTLWACAPLWDRSAVLQS